MNPHKFNIKVSALMNTLSLKEIALFLTLGNIINDIMMTYKLLVAFANQYEDEYENKITTYQVIALVIDLIGKMFECKKTINRAFSEPDMKRKYQDGLSDEGKKALEKINNVMGRESFKQIRHKLANHYDVNKMEKVLDENLGKIKEFEIMVGPDWSSTRFLIADLLRSYIVWESFGCTDVDNQAQVEKAMIDIITTLSECTSSLHTYVNELAKKMLEDIDDIDYKEVTGFKAYKLSDLKIPFFVSK